MATSVASAACKTSLQVSCSCYSNAAGESKVLPRHGLSFASAKVFSPLMMVSNGSKVNMMSEGEKRGIIDHVGGSTALALLAAAIIPEIAEAAQPGISPSLKNLLLSVVAGGVVLVVIGVAVAAVSTFDPVKRK